MRVAHFSDLHLLSLEGVGPGRFLNKRITGYANLRLKRGSVHRSAYVRAIAREIAESRVDHVVISGDLTNLALEPEFALAREVIEKDLALPPADVTIVPGNHDLYTRGAESSRRFAAYFSEYLTSDLAEFAVDTPGGRFPVVKLRGPAAFIGLSSAVTRPPFVAAGKLGSAQLGALARILLEEEVRKRTPIVVLHHPAHNPRSKLKTLLEGLHDAALLWTSMNQLPAGMILHGHLHKRVQRVSPTATGKIHHVGATSASLHHAVREKMAGFNVYSIETDGTIGLIEAHILEPDTQTFRRECVPRFVEGSAAHGR